ncbi:hypothetical protein M378DRAFT_865411 [Amanita muscaria Koide BX008]|uniref:Uncharacterized protein n=1 Tax=Amanita muscaria (strain Koide BX008) TaxID=946122 RepID=A0A0C2SJU5_AMAMK|nr:hypothetical protein M378DRAFT_865411 [Amanita muscaria Koide BX008]
MPSTKHTAINQSCQVINLAVMNGSSRGVLFQIQIYFERLTIAYASKRRTKTIKTRSRNDDSTLPSNPRAQTLVQYRLHNLPRTYNTAQSPCKLQHLFSSVLALINRQQCNCEFPRYSQHTSCGLENLYTDGLVNCYHSSAFGWVVDGAGRGKHLKETRSAKAVHMERTDRTVAKTRSLNLRY